MAWRFDDAAGKAAPVSREGDDGQGGGVIVLLVGVIIGLVSGSLMTLSLQWVW